MYIIIKHMAAICAFQIPRCLILALSACVYRLGHVQMDDDGDELGDEGEPGFPPGSFRPGRVVWAKVDGHEWWPAKVKLRCHHLHDTTSAVHSTRAMLQVLSCLNAPVVTKQLWSTALHPCFVLLSSHKWLLPRAQLWLMARDTLHDCHQSVCSPSSYIHFTVPLATSLLADIPDAGCEKEGSPQGGRPSPRRPCTGAHTDSSGLLHQGRGARGGGRHGCQLTGPGCCLHPSNGPLRLDYIAFSCLGLIFACLDFACHGCSCAGCSNRVLPWPLLSRGNSEKWQI